MTPIMILPTAAAATCQRRRNTYLPGTIREPLQITAVLGGCDHLMITADPVHNRWIGGVSDLGA
jgi:hypothetical protein